MPDLSRLPEPDPDRASDCLISTWPLNLFWYLSTDVYVLSCEDCPRSPRDGSTYIHYSLGSNWIHYDIFWRPHHYGNLLRVSKFPTLVENHFNPVSLVTKAFSFFYWGSIGKLVWLISASFKTNLATTLWWRFSIYLISGHGKLCGEPSYHGPNILSLYFRKLPAAANKFSNDPIRSTYCVADSSIFFGTRW